MSTRLVQCFWMMCSGVELWYPARHRCYTWGWRGGWYLHQIGVIQGCQTGGPTHWPKLSNALALLIRHRECKQPLVGKSWSTSMYRFPLSSAAPSRPPLHDLEWSVYRNGVQWRPVMLSSPGNNNTLETVAGELLLVAVHSIPPPMMHQGTVLRLIWFTQTPWHIKLLHIGSVFS